MDAMRDLPLTPAIHKKFEMANGEAAIAGLKVLLKLHHDPHPWDRAFTVTRFKELKPIKRAGVQSESRSASIKAARAAG